MDFDEDMLGLQIEDLGEYFLQTDIDDNWKGFSLGYTEDEQQQQIAEVHDSDTSFSSAAAAAGGGGNGGGSFMQHLTSPPLSEMLKHGTGLEDWLGFGSPRKDIATLFQTGLTPAGAKPDAVMMNQATRDKAELENFSLDQHKQLVISAMPELATANVSTSLDGSIKPASPKMPSLQCQNILSSDDDDMNIFGEADSFNRRVNVMTVSCYPSVCSTIGSKSAISAPSPPPEDDRGFRKKSREKMRRQEVNVKFEELVDLLGLSNRVRKSAVLQEAVSTINTLKRERDELRRDRDRLLQEVSKLATCLQYSQLGSVAAANAVAMIQQPNQPLPHRNSSAQFPNQQHDRPAGAVSSRLEAVHTHPLDVLCNPGTNCFPISSVFSNLSSQLGSRSPSASSVSGQVTIAPKSLKPAPSSSSYTLSPPTPR
ncbi:unnamed protein product [Peronospora farinosa]|uniref:BHLH domain-containing protein n=1 Tax=Peronospora farinosa TaxID=134698 RepID=A0AAV0U4R8_9STRA|nr:unnamed protein product [Peronospora farinosa]CAI5731831.1 unnamed protein product [Peronospora farinosa]